MRLLLLYLLTVLLFFSCNLINPDEPLPAYIEIEDFSMSTVAGEGTNSQKITEMWAYTNQSSVGVFDLPAEIPVLNEGLTNVRILAGIKNNGIGSTRINYPFYTPYDTIIDFKPGNHYQVYPKFAYTDGLDIDAGRNFESGNFFLAASGNTGNFTVTTNASEVFEGTRSGLASLDGGSGKIFFVDNDHFPLTSGNTIFLEMNYSSNNRFNVGLVSNTAGETATHLAVSINPTAGVNATTPVWNKIYIDLGLIAKQNASATDFAIYLESDPLESDNIRIFLDNLKLVMWDQ